MYKSRSSSTCVAPSCDKARGGIMEFQIHHFQRFANFQLRILEGANKWVLLKNCDRYHKSASAIAEQIDSCPDKNTLILSYRYPLGLQNVATSFFSVVHKHSMNFDARTVTNVIKAHLRMCTFKGYLHAKCQITVPMHREKERWGGCDLGFRNIDFYFFCQ